MDPTIRDTPRRERAPRDVDRSEREHASPEETPGSVGRDHTVAPVTLDADESELPEGSQAPRTAARRGALATIAVSLISAAIGISIGYYFFGLIGLVVGAVLVMPFIVFSLFPIWGAAALRRKDEQRLNAGDEP